MLDDLLGRTTLKTRIAELEEERDRLEERFGAERERRREAVRDKQEAEERENRLEDRIEDLEGRLERPPEESELDFRGVETLRGERLREVLDRLDSLRTDEEGVLTAMVDDLPEEVETAFGDHATLVSRAAPCLAITDDAGLVSAALRPPLAPSSFSTWSDTVALDRGWFLPTDEFAFALVRSDLFAMGEYRGPERETFRSFESDVKGDHSKGGFSQGRFERRRDNQIAAHVEKCREAIDGRESKRLIVVGQRTLLKEFDAEATRAVDATGDPEDALDEAFRDFFTTRLYRI